MNFRKVWVIANSLLLSQLRATSRSGGAGFRSLIRRPLILAILDVVVFVIASGICYAIAEGVRSAPNPTAIATLVENVIVILPSIILGVLLVLGLVLEVSSGASFASSDTVNWLPVRPSEYVLASTLSLFAYYSIFPVAILGGTMSFAYSFGMIDTWGLSATLSIFSIIVSASVLEILRAILNRFSSSFYRRGGQAAIAARAIIVILAFIAFQTIFYPTIYEHFLGVVTAQMGPTWFVPILWASVSVVGFASGELGVSALFAFLAIFLAVALFYGAVAARSRYWVPIPPSIRISSAAYSPRRGLATGVLNARQAALAKKDLRGLVRRREMLRLLALPGIFLVTSLLTGQSGGISFSIYLGVFIVSFSTLFMAMTSVGAEGKSILNLYMAPVSANDFVLGKAVPPILFGSVFGILFYLISALVSPSSALLDSVFIVSSVGLAFELAFLGLLIGIRYPNFSESPRSGFVSQTAGLLAFPVAIVTGGVSLSPLLIASVLQAGFSNILLGLAISVVVISVGSYAFYRFGIGGTERLLDQIPI